MADANYERLNSTGGDSVGDPAYYEKPKTELAKANRACELLRHDPDSRAYRHVQYDIARLYLELGQHTSASTVLKEADDLYEVAERKGSLTMVETQPGKHCNVQGIHVLGVATARDGKSLLPQTSCLASSRRCRARKCSERNGVLSQAAQRVGKGD